MRKASRRHAALATFAGSGTTILITVLQSFLLVPLALARLGTPLYGAWIGASELLTWIQLLDAGIPNLVTQRVGAAAGRDALAEAARWSSTGFALLGAIAVALTAIGLTGSPLVAEWAGVSAADAAVFTACFRTAVVASAALLLFNGIVGLARGVQRPIITGVGQVAGALSGLAVSIALLWIGWGLWALAIGLVVRAAVSLIGGAVFLVSLPRGEGSWVRSPSRRFGAETASLMPSMAGASVGYLLANNTEILLVTTLFGPTPAAVYALTRRAIDGLRRMLDTIAWAVYGGFAHLVSADDRHRARGVSSEVLSLRFMLACLTGAVAAAVNQGFVGLLFGPENFGGFWLTAAFAVQMVLGGQSFLANYLFRATGYVREGSHLLTVEALCRVAAMGAGLVVAGLAGAPWASAAASAAMLGVLARRLDRVLPPAGAVRAHEHPRAVAAIVLVGGLVVGAVWVPSTWPLVAATAAATTLAGAALLWWAAGAGAWRILQAAWRRS